MVNVDRVIVWKSHFVLQHTNGEEKTVQVRVALDSQKLIIKYGDLSGEFYFDVQANTLHATGKGGGAKRAPISGWKAKDIEEVRKLWRTMRGL